MKAKLSLIKSILVASSVVAIATMSANSATAADFSFGNIAGGDAVGDAYQSSFGFNVTSAGANSVLFNIFNSGNAAASSMFISRVFFDTGSNANLLSNLITNSGNSGTVGFTKDSSPGNLPQAANLATSFSTDFSASSNNGGGNKWGVQGGESLGIAFNGNYNSVVSALNNGSLRLGLHVQALPNGASDSYVAEPVPEPTTMLGSVLALGLFAKIKQRRAQKAA